MHRGLADWKDSNGMSCLFYVVKQYLITKFFQEHYSDHGKDLNAGILCYAMLWKLDELHKHAQDLESSEEEATSERA